MSDSGGVSLDSRLSHGSAASAPGRRILLVEDDDLLRRSYVRFFASEGFAVEEAADGASALRRMEQQSFDVVISDIGMPEMNGMELLRAVRARDLDVPVILLTGAPTIDTALQAVEFGAMRYVAKPVPMDELIRIVREAFGLHTLAIAKRQALELLSERNKLLGDRAGLENRFAATLTSLWVAFQPIVSASKRTIYAYEALMRSVESTLPTPDAVLRAAERLDQVHALGRIVRERAVAPYGELPSTVCLFVNLHPRDLLDDDLLSPDAPLSRVASRVVLELTERESLDDIPDLRERVASLRAMGFRIAIDDVGAGYAGLASFALLEPEVVKIDMSLIRDIDKSPTKHRLVGSLASACRDLGIEVVAEGIETREERDVVVDLGIDLLQGYFFAKPGRPFPKPSL